MNTLSTAFIVFFTITLGMGFGVATGYLIITAVLNLFARKAEPSKPEPALVAQGVSGD